jgi:glycosyltransferase involved in cell wall biosynthesis
VKNVYQENDLLLFLSKHESFGNVVVESVLTQTPVIASAIPAMKEIFSEYPEFLVELDNHIFDSIICKLKNLDSLKISVSKARKDFARKFNAENHMNRIKELYLEK